ncbi:outer membrane protein A [Kingella potus]|uniref:Outer membrane protein A n=1 Tax=Kingella potus TaxID=265175 RepID=A0A377QY54_9NEIS|nr:OmpA family protein [Kingella potus]UOP01388.1 OmpA family protein [Kingella potus]STR00296.1 outer membrane protein A [Kingella potus]
MSSNQKEKEQKIGLWVAGSAAGLAVLVILFLSVWGWETGRIEGSPDYGRAASQEAAASQAEAAAPHEEENQNGAGFAESGVNETLAQDQAVPPQNPVAPEAAPEAVPEAAPLPEAAPETAADPVPAAEAAQDEAKIVAQGGVVKFYFATGKSDVPAGAQEALKDVLVAVLGGKKVVVSGYHDSTGNAAFNEELSKQRALAVRAVLQGFGVPEKQIELRKPEHADAGSGEEARRVEVFAE